MQLLPRIAELTNHRRLQTLSTKHTMGAQRMELSPRKTGPWQGFE